ncbi:MAG TPA: hypothetical protein VK628_09185 [Flavitalea sp.]|nr:hypothetical protein [Flavitalea sp.]
MEPEFILLVVFVLVSISRKIRTGNWDLALAGRMGMSALLLITTIGHFMFAKGMAMILPNPIPFKMEIVYLTGLLEVAAAIGLMLARFRKLTAWLLVIFFITIIPANIYEAIHHVDIETATYTGGGPAGLWYRIPVQFLFIAIVYFSAIGNKQDNPYRTHLYRKRAFLG